MGLPRCCSITTASFLQGGFASPIDFLLHKQEGFFPCLTLKSHCLLVRRKQGMNSDLLTSLGAMQTPWCRFCWWLCSSWLPVLRLLQELCCQNHPCSPSLAMAEGCFSINRSLESGLALPVLFPPQISCQNLTVWSFLAVFSLLSL